MKINDKKLEEVTGGFSERTSVVYTLEYGDCFKCNNSSIYYIPHTYQDVLPESYISVERFIFDPTRNVYSYDREINNLFTINVIKKGYLGKLTNLVRD